MAKWTTHWTARCICACDAGNERGNGSGMEDFFEKNPDEKEGSLGDGLRSGWPAYKIQRITQGVLVTVKNTSRKSWGPNSGNNSIKLGYVVYELYTFDKEKAMTHRVSQKKKEPTRITKESVIRWENALGWWCRWQRDIFQADSNRKSCDGILWRDLSNHSITLWVKPIFSRKHERELMRSQLHRSLGVPDLGDKDWERETVDWIG